MSSAWKKDFSKGNFRKCYSSDTVQSLSSLSEIAKVAKCLISFPIANKTLLTSALWTKILFHCSWTAKMLWYFYCFPPEAKANPFASWPALSLDKGSTETWCSRCHFPSCCRAGWHCIPFLGREQGHDLPWLRSSEKQAAPHHPWKVSRS